MKKKTVKDLMVPLSEYAAVSDEATLFEAVLALEKAQKNFDQSRYPHRAILVFGPDQKVVGKISQQAVLRSLEPKFDQVAEEIPLSRFGLSPKFLKTLFQQFNLFEKPFTDICRKAGQLKVKTFMTQVTEGEYVDEEATLDEAIHQLVMLCHQSLLVTRQEEVVGILRLTDVFQEVCETMKACAV